MRRASRLAQAEEEALGAVPELAAPHPPSPPRAEARDDWLGAVVDRRYRVTERIGRGGVGTVYKVEHQRIGKIAAMKVIRSELAGDPEVQARFRREAEVISRLTHPNTVQVFDFGEFGGALYLVMEYARGRDLGRVIESDGPLPPRRAVPLVLQIAEALAEAHELGVVHRDLKPENVLVTRGRRGEERVKVLDFGLAAIAEGDEPSSATTRDGSVMGTPLVMAPEQIRGEPVDPRADLYALGALLYRAITGMSPFEAETPIGVLTKHLTDPVVPPSERRPDLDLEPGLDAVIERAMAKTPAHRYPRATDFAAALEGLGRGEGQIRPGARASADPPWAPGAAGARREVGAPGGSALGQSESGAPKAGAPDAAHRPPSASGADSDRLRRADVDAFEAVLARRRRLRKASIPTVAIAALAAGAIQIFGDRDRPRTREAEPNHQLDDATPIAPGEPVRGHIGQRLSETESDRDFFRVVPEPALDERHIADVEVTGLPNMALQLGLYSETGELVAQSDEGGVGEGEALREVIRGPVYVLVTESRPPGELPTENISDAYELVVTLEAASNRKERAGDDRSQKP